MYVLIDTLKIYERLKDADLPDKAAKEITEVFKDIIENNLATKRDLKELELRLTVKLGAIMTAGVAAIAAIVKLAR
ncbi:MAG: DUF1640 domain-containing protein [Nitrospirae bacterium]|nr:DUF1640 domain-containing protein [Nitrospirota bacterium]